MISKKDIVENFISCFFDAALFATTGTHSGSCLRKTIENIGKILSGFTSDKETDSDEDFCKNIDLDRYWFDEEYRNEVHERCGCRIVRIDEQQPRKPIVVDLRPKRNEFDFDPYYYRHKERYEFLKEFELWKESKEYERKISDLKLSNLKFFKKLS